MKFNKKTSWTSRNLQSLHSRNASRKPPDYKQGDLIDEKRTAISVESRKGPILNTDFKRPVNTVESAQTKDELDQVKEGTDEATDWTEIINIDPQFAEYRERLIETLEPFKDMWDGTLAKVNVGKHRIELKPGAKPVYQAPRRAGPKQRDLELDYITLMMKKGRDRAVFVRVGCTFRLCAQERRNVEFLRRLPQTQPTDAPRLVPNTPHG